MTGFQKTIATIGGMAALVALFLSIGQADDAGWPIVVGSLALAGIGLRHYLGIVPQARLDLLASLGGMMVLLGMLRGGMPAASWPFLIACWLLGWLAVEKSLAARNLSRTVSSIVSLAVPVFFGAWIIFVW